MLFDVTRSELVDIFGDDQLVTLPASAFPPAAAETEGARLLQTVGVPAEAFLLYEPNKDSGRLSLVRNAVHVEDFADVPEDAGEWPLIGWLLNAHLALDPGSGKVYAFDPDEETSEELHTDVSSLVQVAVRFQRLLDEFTFSGDQDASFELLEREVERIRQETSSVDPLPFRHDETAWSVIGDEIAMGQHFKDNSPGGRAFYG